MVRTQNLKTPFWLGLQNEKTVAPVWTQTAPFPAVRHPSRPKVRYRPRGTAVSSNQILPHNTASQVELEELTYWEQRTTLVAKERDAQRKKNAIYAGVALAGLIAFLGGYLVATRPSANTQMTELDLDVTQVAPEMTMAMPAGEKETRVLPRDVTPVLEAPQPSIMTLAPSALQAPNLTIVPVVGSQADSLPETLIPVAIAIPQQDDAFVCQFCTSAFPQFNQVRFDVQATDTTAGHVQVLMNDLAQYESALSLSAIPIIDNQVRFYRAQDAEAARILASRYDAELVDLTWFAPGSDIAKIDVLLSTQSIPAASADGL